MNSKKKVKREEKNPQNLWRFLPSAEFGGRKWEFLRQRWQLWQWWQRWQIESDDNANVAVGNKIVGAMTVKRSLAASLRCDTCIVCFNARTKTSTTTTTSPQQQHHNNSNNNNNSRCWIQVLGWIDWRGNQEVEIRGDQIASASRSSPRGDRWT